MKWSWTLGRIAGIKLRMHWTFLLLLAWVAAGYAMSGGWWAAMQGIAFILAVFVCVVLHECGHALMAARFGIPTEDITLLPIGGVARIRRMPEDPLQELWIAVAGPAVNVAIGLVLFLGLLISHGAGVTLAEPAWGTSFAVNLLWVNIALVVFNLVPAFPMDGGRVLRALLAMRMNYARATRIAATIGQAAAIVFGVVGFFVNPLLLFIAIFVYLGAEAEAQTAQLKDALRGTTVGDAIITRFRTLSADDTLQHAVDELLAGSQQDFPVSDGMRFRGILSRQGLVEGIREQGMTGAVGDWMTEIRQSARRDEPLVATLERMKGAELSALPVMENNRLVGLLCMENVTELLMVHAAAEGWKQQHGDDVEDVLETSLQTQS